MRKETSGPGTGTEAVPDAGCSQKPGDMMHGDGSSERQEVRVCVRYREFTRVHVCMHAPVAAGSFRGSHAGIYKPYVASLRQSSDESSGIDETGHAGQVVVSLLFCPEHRGFESHGFPS